MLKKDSKNSCNCCVTTAFSTGSRPCYDDSGNVLKANVSEFTKALLLRFINEGFSCDDLLEEIVANISLFPEKHCLVTIIKSNVPSGQITTMTIEDRVIEVSIIGSGGFGGPDNIYSVDGVDIITCSINFHLF